MQKINFDHTESEFTIRCAKKEDIPQIMHFIKEYWDEGHILANSREMFEFQYVYGEEVCFVISQNKSTSELEGILGYIPYGTEGERDIFTALWKVRKGKNLFQGIDLLYYLEQNARCRDLFCAGINPKTFSIYKYMRKEVTKMEHFYMLNDREEYKIARIVNKIIVNVAEIPYEVRRIEEPDQLQIFGENAEMQIRAMKSREYVKRRFFEHIVYQYDIYEIKTKLGTAYVVGREQEQAGSVIFRIVDIWGSDQAISGIGLFLKDLIYKKQYEYIDCYAYGIDNEIMHQAGFEVVRENDENIIPNYFEPFVRENVTIHIFIPPNRKVRMLKGDGDQDRPNALTGKQAPIAQQNRMGYNDRATNS